MRKKNTALESLVNALADWMVRRPDQAHAGGNILWGALVIADAAMVRFLAFGRRVDVRPKTLPGRLWKLGWMLQLTDILYAFYGAVSSHPAALTTFLVMIVAEVLIISGGVGVGLLLEKERLRKLSKADMILRMEGNSQAALGAIGISWVGIVISIAAAAWFGWRDNDWLFPGLASTPLFAGLQWICMIHRRWLLMEIAHMKAEEETA